MKSMSANMSFTGRRRKKDASTARMGDSNSWQPKLAIAAMLTLFSAPATAGTTMMAPCTGPLETLETVVERFTANGWTNIESSVNRQTALQAAGEVTWTLMVGRPDGGDIVAINRHLQLAHAFGSGELADARIFQRDDAFLTVALQFDTYLLCTITGQNLFEPPLATETDTGAMPDIVQYARLPIAWEGEWQGLGEPGIDALQFNYPPGTSVQVLAPTALQFVRPVKAVQGN